MQKADRYPFLPNGIVINDVLALPIIFSWILYPWAISWIYPNFVRLVFGASFFGAALLVIGLGVRQKWQPDRNERILAGLLIGYIISALLASLVFNYSDPGILLRYILKFVFALLLVTYLTRKTIYLAFDIYLWICIVLVSASMASILAIAMGWEQLSFIDVVRGVDDVGSMIRSFSGYDGTARIFPETAKFTRMQSFSPEPGAFAFALLPALYWATIVRQQYARASLIVLGISASWSFGALLAIALAFFSLPHNSVVSRRIKGFLAASIVFFLASHAIFSWIVKPTIGASSTSSTTIDSAKNIITGGDKSLSMHQRVSELFDVFYFLQTDFWGAGIGAARRLLDSSISVGYANVFADVGVFGGFLYLSICLILSAMAIRCVLGWQTETQENKAASIALGLSVLTCLFFGLQREQPDASFWHMWIYASFIVIHRINRSNQISTQ